jgi:DNA-binding Lrp family transcriptional regulator
MDAESERALVVSLQAGVPLMERPFRALAQSHGITEDEVLGLARTMLSDGRARRFGAIFDNARLAASTLCAIDTGNPADMAARIVPLPSITHCYQRDGRPNLWFTVTATRERMDHELARIADLAREPILQFPMRRRFKLAVILDPAGTVAVPEGDPSDLGPPVELDASQRRLVAAMQAAMTVQPTPFAALAAAGSDWCESRILDQVRQWRAQGVLRRLALVCRHRNLGFHGNLLAVWEVGDDAIHRAGTRLAHDAHVSHCYERRPDPAFPFNLYAMIHALDPATACEIAHALTEAIGNPRHRLLASRHEYKKTSPGPFAAAGGFP